MGLNGGKQEKRLKREGLECSREQEVERKSWREEDEDVGIKRGEELVLTAAGASQLPSNV